MRNATSSLYIFQYTNLNTFACFSENIRENYSYFLLTIISEDFNLKAPDNTGYTATEKSQIFIPTLFWLLH